MLGITEDVLRIRDPIHDLIAFDLKDERDRLAWQLINSPEFQRLRRIKQLGFGEMVFPGATHTRFSHCLGAYFIARKLLDIVRKKVANKDFDERKAFVAAVAALLHDLGHGPFSHVFERVQRELGNSRRHEEWTGDIILGDSEIHKVLNQCDNSLAADVALLLRRKDPSDIYDAVVSSQFDADRLDYLQRDRYMTGTHTGALDIAWLLDCLETGKINIGQQDDYVEVDGLYLNHKGLAAAEGYLLARFHLYSQVYLHKTTRSAERMLAALLARVAKLAKEGNVAGTGLHETTSLVRFFTEEKPTPGTYLELDDPAIWVGISEMAKATDHVVSHLAIALRDRKLYKSFDIGEMTKRAGSDSLPHFKRRLQEGFGDKLGTSVLKDEASLTAYGVYEYEDPSAFQKVLIGRPDGSGRSDDIAERSEIVSSIKRQKIFRVYCPDAAGLQQMADLWKEVIK